MRNTRKLMLIAMIAFATSAALAVSAGAQTVDRPSAPVLSVSPAPSFKPPIVTRRFKLLVPALGSSLDRLSTSAPSRPRESLSRPLRDSDVAKRWPFRADPRRWPRLFANTTECSLSFDPILRRHWFD